jgi:hypothetical protein
MSQAASFKEEYKSNLLVKSEPECMTDRPALEPSVPTLSADEVKEAKEALVNTKFVALKFPRAQRFRVDPPINQQNYYSLHSFTPSPGAKADKDGCFGVMKIRGVFGNLQEADAWAEHLIRSVDSLHEIHIGYVGKEFPLTLDPLYFSETHEIDMKKKMDDIERAHAKTVREKEQEDMETLKKREKELLDSSKKSPEEAKEDIDHYIALRVKCANILHVRDETLAKLEKFDQTRQETMAEIAEMDKAHPEYANDYLEKFKKSLEEVGIKDTPLLKYM